MFNHFFLNRIQPKIDYYSDELLGFRNLAAKALSLDSYPNSPISPFTPPQSPSTPDTRSSFTDFARAFRSQENWQHKLNARVIGKQILDIMSIYNERYADNPVSYAEIGCCAGYAMMSSIILDQLYPELSPKLVYGHVKIPTRPNEIIDHFWTIPNTGVIIEQPEWETRMQQPSSTRRPIAVCKNPLAQDLKWTKY